MSTHIRQWGIAIATAVAFAIPHTALQAGINQASIAQNAQNAATAATPAVQQVLKLKITAYASTPDETDDTPFITADGSYVHDGVVATNLLPFGTKVMIPALFGDKVFTVDDRMSRKLMNNLDVWMTTKTQALLFGAHSAQVLVIGGSATTAPQTADAASAPSPVTSSKSTLAIANAFSLTAISSRLPDLSVRQL